jgi:2,3-bisphosphoglycerate-dependent phosphoglycerate mutase
LNVATLILLRHGESIWNRQNRFTGWVDVSLSRVGIAEAERAAVKLREELIELAE